MLVSKEDISINYKEGDRIFIYTSAAAGPEFALKLVMLGSLLGAEGLFCNHDHLQALSNALVITKKQLSYQFTEKFCNGWLFNPQETNPKEKDSREDVCLLSSHILL